VVPAPADRTPPYLDAPRPLAMAHRGGATYPPNRGLENTMAAFGRAVELGYGYLETDVRATRDGIPVLLHDRTLQRLADRPDAVADLSWDELQALRIGGREPVPALAELLAAFPDVRLNIDVKSDDAMVPTVAAVCAAGADSIWSWSARNCAKSSHSAGSISP